MQDQAYISVRETPSAYIFWIASVYNDFMDTVHEKILLKIFGYGTSFREKNHLLVNFLPHSSFEPLTPKISGVLQKLTWCQQFGVQHPPKWEYPKSCPSFWVTLSTAGALVVKKVKGVSTPSIEASHFANTLGLICKLDITLRFYYIVPLPGCPKKTTFLKFLIMGACMDPFCTTPHYGRREL